MSNEPRDGQCTNCGRFAQVVSRGPYYDACLNCRTYAHKARRGRVCSVCRAEGRYTIIYHAKVVCGHCLPEKNLLYLFMRDESVPVINQETNPVFWVLLGSSFTVILLLWLVVSWMG